MIAGDGTFADRINVTWGDVAGRDGFKVFRSASAASGYTQIGATGLAVRAFADTTVSCGETWYYRVVSFNGNFDSAFSPADQGSTLLCPPAAPSGVAAGDGTGKFAVEVTWEDVAGESGYRIYRSPAGGASYMAIGTVGAGILSYVDSRECDSAEYVYKVTAYNAGGESGFSLSDTGYTGTCGIDVDSPAGGETWLQGEIHEIAWSGEVDTGSMKIELYKGSAFKGAIVPSTPNDGSFDWTIPATLPTGTDYRVKVSWTSNLAIHAYSGQFAVGASPGPIVVTPEATVAQGDVQTIAWTGIPQTGKVKILLFKGTATTPKATISASAPNNGFFDWIVPATLPIGTDYSVQVVWLSHPAVKDTSGLFVVTATPGPIVVDQPAGGEVWEQGSTQTVAWSGIPQAGTVKIELYKGTAFYKVLLASTPNDGSQQIAVPPVPALTANCRIKVTWLQRPTTTGLSNPITIE